MPEDEDFEMAARNVAGEDDERTPLQESCARADLKIRWVNGDAQLANSLTNSHDQGQLILFYKLGGRWRLVYDETYTSARKRRQAGTTTLDGVPMSVTEITLDADSESNEASTI